MMCKLKLVTGKGKGGQYQICLFLVECLVESLLLCKFYAARSHSDYTLIWISWPTWDGRLRATNLGVCVHVYKNIARGTTDPEINTLTWIEFSNSMAPLALVANLATR